MSPCGQNIVTGAGDETLRFWNCLPAPPNKNNMFGKNFNITRTMELR